MNAIARGATSYIAAVDIHLGKIIVIGAIGVLLVGPAKLPQYAQKLAELVKAARTLLQTAKERVREDLGPAADDIDWQQLDPRQYDPRRIIRDALLVQPTSVTASVPSQSPANPAPVSASAQAAVGSDGTAAEPDAVTNSSN